MAKASNKLTAVALRNPAIGRRWDGGGLYLEVIVEGGRYWRWKYRHGGKEKRLGFGAFPEVSLSDARKRRDEARKLLQAGTDPSEQRKTDKADELRASRGTFGAVCADWLAFKDKTWAPESLRKADYVARTYLLPKLKTRKVATLASKDVGAVLKGIAEHAPDLARKARQYSQWRIPGATMKMQHAHRRPVRAPPTSDCRTAAREARLARPRRRPRGRAGSPPCAHRGRSAGRSGASSSAP